MPIEPCIGHAGRTFHRSAMPMDDSFSHADRTPSTMLIEHSIGYARRFLPTTYALSPAPYACLNRQTTRADMCTDMCIDQCIDAHADIRWACTSCRRRALVETVQRRSTCTPVYTHGPCRRQRRRRTPPFLHDQPLSERVHFLFHSTAPFFVPRP